MPDYSRIMIEKRADRKRQQIFIFIVAAITLVFFAITYINSRKIEAFVFTEFFAADASVEVITTASGLKYQDLVIGDGEVAKVGDDIVVHYTGWLTDENKFDSSVDRNNPFDFTLGIGRVIQGWDEGVTGMRVGGTRLLMIPAELGYGDSGSVPSIPPGATLIVQVALLALATPD